MNGQSFGRPNRLRNSFEFRRVREKGISFKDKTFGMTILKNDTGTHRLGLSISKSAVRLASRRNRLKRLMRELFRTNKNKIKDGRYDIVFYVKRPLPDDFDCDCVRESLLSLMKRSKILC